MRAWRLALAPVALLAASASAATPSSPASCALHPVLLEEFNDASIAATTFGPARWTAHTPWGGDFGDARFADPGPGGPFAVKNGVLAITARKDAAGRWTSGLIAAADATGKGLGTRYGYFEARMKLPPGPGVWPAFWLAALKPATQHDGNVEVDVIEYYGQFPDAYRTALHVWYADPKRTRGEGAKIDVPAGALVGGWHSYGVDVSPQAIVFFLDRRKVWSRPTPKEIAGPLYPLVDLGLGGGWPVDRTPNPSTLRVDYVHVWGRGPGPAGGCPPGLPQGMR